MCESWNEFQVKSKIGIVLGILLLFLFSSFCYSSYHFRRPNRNQSRDSSEIKSVQQSQEKDTHTFSAYRFYRDESKRDFGIKLHYR